MEVPLRLMCLEDAGQEHAMNFLSLWLAFMCYVYPSVLVWCFQIVISAKHTKWQHIVAIKT